MKEVNVVAGVIYNNDEILCTLRDKSKYDYISFKYEFPGGKIEEGETEEQALKRELFEELELKVEILNKLGVFTYNYPDFTINMTVFVCQSNDRNIKLNVHAGAIWKDKNSLVTLDWAGVDKLVVDKILEK